MNWLDSIYSDGSKLFVSNPFPKVGEIVTVWIRMFENAPVDNVFLRAMPNGGQEILKMDKRKSANGLAYYATEMKIQDTRTLYHFIIASGNTAYYYTQKEITTYIPEHTYDFVLLTNYIQPEWVKSAVFYQIFPERFCNGRPELDVKDGEYTFDGHQPIKMKNWNDPVLTYEEGHCMDFFGGDLYGIIDKIPYLKELGVTALYLNPIFQGPSVHKYDCVDFFHVDDHFGGDEALAELSKALHENGMKLVLDISINHTGTSHKWFKEAYANPDSRERGYYFFEEGTNNYKGWWDVPTLPTLNYTAEALKEVIYKAKDSVLKKWLKPPYNIDGWRFDVADVFARNGEVQLSHEIWPEIRKSIKEENNQAYILAEDWDECADHLRGDQWDSTMNYYGFARVIRQFLGNPDLFMERTPELKALKYHFTAEDLKARVTENLAKLPFAIWQNQFNLFDSHDVSRLHNYGNIDDEMYKGAVIFMFTLIGAPNVYYGDEAAADGIVGTNEGCRYPMPWDKDIKSLDIYKLYHKLSTLKTSENALIDGGFKFLYAKGDVVSFARFDDKKAFVTVMSVSCNSENVEIPVGIVGVQQATVCEDILGNTCNGTTNEAGMLELELKPHQSVLLEFALQ